MTSGRSLNILIIEDNVPDFILLDEMLKEGKLVVGEISHARSIKEVTVQKSIEYDVVLLDLSLPDSSGIQSVNTIIKEMPQIPLIVLSGLGSIDIAIESISRGAQDYLVKGEFDERLLAKSIQYSIERKRTLALLESNNEKYSFINKATHDTLWEWDFNRKRGRWGEGFLTFFGYRESQKEFGEDWIEIFVHRDDRDRLINKRKFYIENRLEKWRDQYRFLDAEGNYKIVFDRAFILYDNKGLPKRMIGAMADITERKILEQELEQQRISQQQLITELTIEAQEKERNELGRELHDNINQLLATVKLYLGMVRKGLETDKGEELLARCYDYVSSVIEEIRKLSHSLVNPTLSDKGLIETLNHLIEEIKMTTGLQIKIANHLDKMPKIDKKKELMIYRIVQEHMNNIRKHSHAQKVEIEIKQQSNFLELAIKDDGVGFDPKEQAAGIGLQNIRSRIEFYNGEMEIISAPGNGCKLSLKIPM